MDGIDDIVREFLVESYENLDQLDSDLVALEGDPGSRDLLSSIFRTVHTIKGTSGFLAFANLERVSHVGENLLVELRDGLRQMDEPTTDVLLALVDTLRAILGAIESDGTDGVDVEPTIAKITALQDRPAHEAAPAQAPDATEPVPAPEPAPTPDPTATAEQPAAADSRAVAESVVTAEPAAVEPAAEPPVTPSATRTAADGSIRVDVSLLDALMRQVGELVLVRNQIGRLSESSEQIELSRSAQRLNLIAGELQEGVMKTRMQPIDHIWSKMPRIVRDLASALGRQVSLSMVGGDTELDRSLLEAVKDPLTHLVRNAVDHGIEDTADRVAAGKSPQGTVTLRAYHAGGQVVVEISDDGHGIDTSAVGATAVKRGLRTAAQIQAMSSAEIHELLFLPGFSTAKKVTNVSGRGVGMDVVRTKVEAIGGSVDVESRLGQGTTWRLRIPLTLAIMPALTVECAGDVFAIAQVNLLELVALDSRTAAAGIEHVGSAPVYRLRGALLPLVRLTEVLGLEPSASDHAVIAVLQADDRRFGLLVDRVLNTEEIVVMALSTRIKQIGMYSGATVLGDGTVSLILDIQAMARRVLVGDSAELARTHAEASAAAQQAASEQLLVVEVGDGRRVAMPLAAVTRLERMPAARVERVGAREVIQYRGDLLPMVRLDQVLGAPSAVEPEELLVVVSTQHGSSVAMVVTEILDIVDEDRSQRSDVDDMGLLGSTVVNGRVTELLDVGGMIRSVVPDVFTADDFHSLNGQLATV